MSRHFHPIHPKMLDFSPTEVADMGLIGWKRSAVYREIKRGKLQTTLDEHGNMRISEAEIDRYNHAHGQERRHFVFHPANPRLWKKWQRERGALGGTAKAMRHTKEEIAEPLRRGKREKFARMVDPEGVLPPDELERRIAIAETNDMQRVRFAKTTKALLREQFGNEQA